MELVSASLEDDGLTFPRASQGLPTENLGETMNFAFKSDLLKASSCQVERDKETKCNCTYQFNCVNDTCKFSLRQRAKVPGPDDVGLDLGSTTLQCVSGRPSTLSLP